MLGKNSTMEQRKTLRKVFHYMKLYLYPSQALNLLIDIALKNDPAYDH